VEGAVTVSNNVHTLEWVRDALEGAGGLVRTSAAVRAQTAWVGAAIDSRSDCAGRLFVALRGEHVDGHGFARAALEAGSPALLISDDTVAASLDTERQPYFLVRDTQRALFELARAFRRRLSARVVAITGSGGKTTTKEYARAVLRAKYRVHANRGNLNSQVGVPLTLLEADEHCDYLVCEVGSNHPGEIAALGELLTPDVAVITNIGDAHVGHFGSRDAIAEEKGSLLNHIVAHGVAVLPRDDDYFEKLDAKVQGKVFSFGRSPAADFRLGNTTFSEGLLRFTINGEPVSLSAVGDYNAMNACAAFAVGDVCGVDAKRMQEALMSVRPTPGRGRVQVVAGVTVIDETYNASPASVRESLAMLASLPARRRIAVLGDMRELGDHVEALHADIGATAARLSVDRVYWLGEKGAMVAAAARAIRPALAVEPCADVTALVAAVARDARDGDAILVKGSRAMKLEEFVTGIVEALARRAKS
jgi:UDP-N-acetylmuramoyl-tripeptide--D-alanyl-D-alanine ligase